MILWFVGVSVAFVWFVFRSPALDYRLVALGSVLPLGEVALGGAFVFHTLLASVVALMGVVLLTRERRLVRRRWIGLPIGMLMHLVLDGVWADSQVFWWPLGGASFGGAELPVLTRPLGVLLVGEVIGAACLVLMWRRFDLADPARRATLWRTGQLPRDAAG